MARHRTYSIDYKRRVVLEVLAGGTLHDPCKAPQHLALPDSSLRSPGEKLTARPERRIRCSGMRPGSQPWSGWSAVRSWRSKNSL